MHTRLFALVLSALLCGPPVAAKEMPAASLFERGDYASALMAWRAALGESPPEPPQARLEALAGLVLAYQALNRRGEAFDSLRQGLALAERAGLLRWQALFHSQMADVGLIDPRACADAVSRQATDPRAHLEKALEIATALGQAEILAHVQNHWGNFQVAAQDYAQAETAYAEAARWAEQARAAPLLAKIQHNWLHVVVETLRQSPAAEREALQGKALDLLERNLALADAQPASYANGMAWIGVGELALRLHALTASAVPLARIHALFERARRIGEKRTDAPVLLAYATGYLGTVYEAAGEARSARDMTRRALFLSQSLPELAYRWEWQAARLWLARGELDQAALAYQRALRDLSPVRVALLRAQRDARAAFRERVRPVYYGLADVLLRQARRSAEPETRSRLLRQVVEVLEQFKTAELQDYFQDVCSTEFLVKTADARQIDPHAAVFYPVVLPDRVELLLLLSPQDYRLFPAATLGAERLGELVNDLSLKIQRLKPHYLPAGQIYATLIAPLRATLDAAHIHTLVIAPDGPLRALPFAALWDPVNKRHLVEDFALAVVPGLRLTASPPLAAQTFEVILGGLAHEVRRGDAVFPALSGARQEVDDLARLLPRHRILFNETFLSDQVKAELGLCGGQADTCEAVPPEYGVLHFASHGQFRPNYKESFLLTYDGVLNMDDFAELKKVLGIRRQPVNLLTLSACETAVGDECAVLGLGGLAVNAGVAGVLATLWQVSDEAMVQLVPAFYRILQAQPATLSKAEALRQAQLSLLRGSRIFRPPYYWAPLLLIGNWL